MIVTAGNLLKVLNSKLHLPCLTAALVAMIGAGPHGSHVGVGAEVGQHTRGRKRVQLTLAHVDERTNDTNVVLPENKYFAISV